MAQVRIKKADWDKIDANIRDERKEQIIGRVFLAEPAIIADAQGVEWAVFDDDRVTYRHQLLADTITEYKYVQGTSKAKVKEELVAAYRAKVQAYEDANKPTPSQVIVDDPLKPKPNKGAQ